MDITSALLAVQNFQSLTAGINWTAWDELLAQQTAAAALDEFVRERAAVATAVAAHVHNYQSIMDLATTHCSYVEMATMPKPLQFEYRVAERVYPTLAWTPIFAGESDFDDEPNQRTIVRPEVKRRIGFRS